MARRRLLLFRRVGSILRRHWKWVVLGVLATFITLWIPQVAMGYGSPSVSVVTQSSTSEQSIAQWRSLYHQGDYEGALSAIEPVASDPGTSDRVRSLADNYLSLTYQKLGDWEAAEAAIDRSWERIENAGDRPLAASILTTRGQLELALGEANNAYRSWEMATEMYRQLEDEEGLTGSLINQSRALDALGFHRRSCDTMLPLMSSQVNTCEALKEELQQLPNEATSEFLEQVLDRVDRQENPVLEAMSLQALGNALRSIGELGISRQVLQKSWQLSSTLGSDEIQSEVLLNLGNTERSLVRRDRDLQRSADNRQGSVKDAIDYYRNAVSLATTPRLKLQAQLNLLGLQVHLEDGELFDTNAQVLARTILSQIDELNPSRIAIEARINLACSVMRCDLVDRDRPSELSLLTFSEVESLLKEGQQQAEQLQDRSSQSYVLGTLGKLYEVKGDRSSEAESYTQRAIEFAREADAPYLTYQWEWQMGRILKSSDSSVNLAISAYEAAIEDLKTLRNELTKNKLDIRLSFREKIDPVYRQFLEILLQESLQTQANLERSRLAIADFQLAELESFLDCNLQDNTPRSLDAIAREQQVAIIYPIILPEQVAVISKLPNSDELAFYETQISESEVLDKLKVLRNQFEKGTITPESFSLSQEVYDWLVRPVEEDLQQQGVKTLVFVPDTRFRNVPMSALRYENCRDDRKCYLLQKYAVVMNLGTSLSNPTPLENLNLTVLAGGLTEALPDRGLQPLSGVDRQLNYLENALNDVRDLRNRGFTRDSLAFSLRSKSFSIVHLATHGEFSSDPEKTRIEAWDSSLFLEDLEFLFQTQRRNQYDPIELLVLSACRTGVEDVRATLGLAGVAIQSGARSTLASLWYINENSSAALVQQFYQNLADPDIPNKVEALRQAQLAMLETTEYQEPLDWAAYILVGNWL